MMLKFPPDNLFKSDTIHDWLVADSKLEKPKLPLGTHEKINAMAVWASNIPKILRGGSDQFLNWLAQGNARVAENLATCGVGFTAGMLVKSGLSEDFPNGPYCAAVALGSKVVAQVLTKSIKGALNPPSYKMLSNIAERALSAPDWKSYREFQSQLLEESVRFGDKFDIRELEQRIPSRFESARRSDLVERLGESLKEVSSYRPESPLRKSIDAVKQKIKEQHQDFTR